MSTMAKSLSLGDLLQLQPLPGESAQSYAERQQRIMYEIIQNQQQQEQGRQVAAHEQSLYMNEAIVAQSTQSQGSTYPLQDQSPETNSTSAGGDTTSPLVDLPYSPSCESLSLVSVARFLIGL